MPLLVTWQQLKFPSKHAGLVMVDVQGAVSYGRRGSGAWAFLLLGLYVD